jgi:hypothetical protein
MFTPPFDDPQAMAVFADLLSSRGDPRGELAQLHLALEHRPFDPALQRAVARHLALHDRELLGPLRTATTLFEFHWQRGFIVSAELKSQAGLPHWSRGRLVEPPARSRLPRALQHLLALESARFLRHLTISLPFSRFGQQTLLDCAHVLGRAPHRLASLAMFLLVPASWDEHELEPRETKESTLGDLNLTLDASIAAQVQLSLRR